MKRITVILTAMVFGLCIYAQKPEITMIGIAGRAVQGFNDFNQTEMFSKTAEGEFSWVGYLYYSQPGTSSGSKGFKCKVNSTSQGNDWLLAGFYSLRAVGGDNVEVSDGNTYPSQYSAAQSGGDYKWRLKEGEDGWHKITYYTSDVDNVTMRVDKVEGNFANLASLSVDNGVLTPDFDPDVTTYSCVLTQGTLSATPNAGTFTHNPASGTDAVDVSGGSGVSSIVVTSLDESVTKTYVINYSIAASGPVDYTSVIINNNFDYVAQDVAFGDTENYPLFPGLDNVTSAISSAWRPVKQSVTKIENHLDFYGWQFSNWEFLWKDNAGNFINVDETSPNQSLGINAGVTTTNGSAAWIAGNKNCSMPNDFEFYQVIDKNDLAAGTYKLTCLLGIQSGYLTSQRLFANNSVQFYGQESDYEQNKTEGEIYSYGNYATSSSGDTHHDMKVYVTISDNDSLKIGIRSGNMKGDGTEPVGGGNLYGWFKMDDFRLQKLDPADAANAGLTDIILSAGTLEFNSETTLYNVELPQGTSSVTVTAMPAMEDAKVEGVEAVDVSLGSGVSNITVTALDGTTTKNYTINYTVNPATGLSDPDQNVSCFVHEGRMTVKGVNAYSVYAINGMKTADVKNNTSATSIWLMPGVYIVKTENAGVFKVVVR